METSKVRADPDEDLLASSDSEDEGDNLLPQKIVTNNSAEICFILLLLLTTTCNKNCNCSSESNEFDDCYDFDNFEIVTIFWIGKGITHLEQKTKLLRSGFLLGFG